MAIKPKQIMGWSKEKGCNNNKYVKMKNMNTIKNFKTSKDYTLMDGFPFEAII